MNTEQLAAIAKRILRHPTAPYFEDEVRSEVELTLGEQGIPFQRDTYGNVIAHLCSAPEVRPIIFAAHMDHPGFRIERKIDESRWLGTFLGWVPEIYFKQGTALRLFPGDLPALLGPREAGAKQYVIEAQTGGVGPRFAMWDLPAFQIRSGRVVSRACDDLAGTACAIAALIALKQTGGRVNAMAVLSRAEEVGFHGALALAAERTLPQDSLVISLETSRELPGVRQGAGVILRVGDKATTFDRVAGVFLAEVAAKLAREDPEFVFQRALMSGGTCEATAYQHFGYQTTGVCVALRNYHNCGPKDEIQAENVHLGDLAGMAHLLGFAAREMPRFTELSGTLANRLERLLGEARSALRK